MPRIIIRRHGNRWALLDNPDASPVAEYRTRQLAEVAAHHRAEGGEVVWEEDTGDEQLGGGAVGDEDRQVRNRDAGIDQRTGGAGSGADTPREPQAGL